MKKSFLGELAELFAQVIVMIIIAIPSAVACIVAPKFCAKILGVDTKKLSATARFFADAVGTAILFISKVLPWQWRKIFMADANRYYFGEYRDEEQIRFYLDEDSSVETLEKMSHSSIRKLWMEDKMIGKYGQLIASKKAMERFKELPAGQQAAIYLRQPDEQRLVKAMSRQAFASAWSAGKHFGAMLEAVDGKIALSFEEFSAMLDAKDHSGDHEAVMAYLKSQEPTTQMLDALVCKGWDEELGYSVRHYGLTKEAINSFSYPVLEAIQDDLTCFRQKKALRSGICGLELKAFFAFYKGEIQPEAQAVMNRDQVEAFYRAGYRLDQDVVVRSMNANIYWFELMLELDGQTFGVPDEVINDILQKEDVARFELLLKFTTTDGLILDNRREALVTASAALSQAVIDRKIMEMKGTEGSK